jgi:hypothetical protein
MTLLVIVSYLPVSISRWGMAVVGEWIENPRKVF